MPCGKTKHDTLCWDCEKAVGKCSWSKNFVPVEGWKAVPTKIQNGNHTWKGRRIKDVTDSFDVYECPEFELMNFIKQRMVYGNGKK